MRAVIRNLFHDPDRLCEAVFCAVYAMPGKSVDHSIHRLLKGGIGTSFCELIRTDLPEQFLQNIDHRKRVGDPERGEEI